MPAGFTLPAILVVVGALLILAVGVLLIVGIERNTARSFVDRQRAELAAKAGLEEVRGILTTEAANDDFIVLQGQEAKVSGTSKEQPPYLYVARGSGGGKKISYRYVPLFSAPTFPSASAAGALLQAPDAKTLVGSVPVEFSTLSWYEPTKVSWINITNPDGKLVSRYAYWVEDMQGKIDARVSGNVDGAAGVHARSKFPNPSAMPVVVSTPPLSAVAVHVLDPKSTDEPTVVGAGGKSLTQQVIDARPVMISPDSIIGATGILGISTGQVAAPRDQSTGLLTNPTAAAMEREVSTVNQPYLEQAVVPFSGELSGDVTGKPKKNLNKLLTGSRSAAVDEMASWIKTSLPKFESRKGGFPDDYIKTLAAGALDYADEDSDPTISEGSYVGLDSYPLMSEIVLHINFLGSGKTAGRHVLQWQIKVFGELWNMTTQDVSGPAQLSYEVNLKPDPVGVGGGSDTYPFDDPELLSDGTKSKHNLVKIGSKYYGPSISVSLKPDEYKFYEFASVNYTIDYTPQLKNGQPISEPFDLVEPETEARGITLRWNNQPVQTLKAIVRDPFGVSNFMTKEARKAGKAAIPGHSYGPYGFFKNNMGDPRIASYLRTTRLGENAFPENLSPGRRNIRRESIYDKDPYKEKKWHFGRVLPSEWPDGGHDSPTGSFNYSRDNAVLPTDTKIYPPSSMPVPSAQNAPQQILNHGRFYSACELGRIYDPVLWTYNYKDLKGKPGSGKTDSETLIRDQPKPEMPSARNYWPEVTSGSSVSTDYGGGNTLRIGRPEHGKFDFAGTRATQLLDLFHAGISTSETVLEREGTVVQIKGNINVNTAGKDALRAMAAGMLQQDPELRRVTSWEHDIALYRPKTVELKLGTPTTNLVADQIAEALMLRRPFASPSEMASVLNKDGDPVFGNRDLYKDYKDIQWSDAAAEEVFSRVYDASTVRSRNFRVWVIGQALTGTEANPEVLAETRRAFTLFADPGERKTDGAIDPVKYNPRVTYENDF